MRTTKSPESQIKSSIFAFLELYSKKSPMIFWNQESVGIWDEKLGKYRKKSSKWQKNGVADIIIIKNFFDLPCAIFLEVKAPKGKQSDEQKVFEKEIEEINGFYFIVKSIDEVAFCLESVRQKIETRIDRVAALREGQLKNRILTS